MSAGNYRPRLSYLPLLLSFAIFSVASVVVVLAHSINNEVKVSEDFVILTTIGLVIFAFLLEALAFA